MTSSDPASSSGSEPSLFTAGISEVEAQARATSSITITVASASAPAPPYCSGMCGAWKSAAFSASYDAFGNSASLVDVSGVRGHLGVADVADGVPDRLVLLGRRVQIVECHSQGAA